MAIIVKNGQVLLGYKKKGEIGAGTLNSPGGKCEEGESPIQCVIRETREELGINLSRENLEEVAIITFFAANVPDFKVHVFLSKVFEGEPEETEDMIPEWHDIRNLPLGKMLESDRHWFSKALSGEKFKANVFYKKRATGFERIEFFLYS